jgi:hypothetical protein
VLFVGVAAWLNSCGIGHNNFIFNLLYIFLNLRRVEHPNPHGISSSWLVARSLALVRWLLSLVLVHSAVFCGCLVSTVFWLCVVLGAYIDSSWTCLQCLVDLTR